MNRRVDERCPSHRFTRSATTQWAAFAWGLAEATVFFIVPDVLLTAVGCRSIRAGLQATGMAILGAVLGGLILYAAGRTSPDAARALLTRVPAIHPELLEQVRSQLSVHGVVAVLIGPAVGIPYKVYAVEWGARPGGLPIFLLVSVPARGIRFLFGVLCAGGVARLIAPWTHHRPPREMVALALFWLAFYGFYFARFGW